MGDYTKKLKDINKGLDELIFLLTLATEKKTSIENLGKELDNCGNEVLLFRKEFVKDNVDLSKLLEETKSCNQEFRNYIIKYLDLKGLIYQLSYLDELKFDLEREYDTVRV